MPFGSILDAADTKNGPKEPVHSSARFVNGLLEEMHRD